MEIKAEARNIRMTPRKARLVMDLVRGKEVGKAMDMLKVMHHKAAPIISKVIKSAVSNAENNFKLKGPFLISKAYINAGPLIKRLETRARGRANIFHKKISHVTIYITERSN
ncbi:MAG TPA: 50S ribosomal protein L22 [Fusobacteria bacterium]|nr:50S ribosomal protein L22 [Fusobacteriota bacterium]|tara:strand:+ start:26507 stop:26842 length:336 start_codon:yes stop_codon:yes gene_type:complete